jgi:glycogen synthase
MPLVSFCLRLHEPCVEGLAPTTRRHDAFDTHGPEARDTTFIHRAEKCYLPTLEMFTAMVRSHVDFKIGLCVSGTFLELAQLHQPKVIEVLRQLCGAGRSSRQVELVDLTYYHSLVSYFSDPRKTEFQEQVALYRQTIHDLFDLRPTAFVNTDLLYNNETANIVADMGYKTMLCDPCQHMIDARTGHPITVGRVFRAKGRNGRARKLAVLPRNPQLSQELSLHWGDPSLTAQQYARRIASTDGDVLAIVCDFPLLETGADAYERMVQFWTRLREELFGNVDTVMTNPTEVAEWFQITECRMIDCPSPASVSPDTPLEVTPIPLRSGAQRILFENMEALETPAKRAGGELLRKFRYLTTSDHWRDMAESDTHGRHESATMATYALTHAIDDLSQTIKSFNILKRSAATPVIIITPETARLPSEGMGQFAKFVSGKSGGLGEVISALCKGLADRRIPVHLITINLTRRFREEAGLSESEWIQKRHQLNPENVHLVSSAIFEGYRSAYDGWPLANAAEFQKQIVNTYIKDIRSLYEGRAILHTNDWMAGGVVAAYARLRGVPLLHTVHNTHTGHIPLDMFYGVNLQKLWDMLYLSDDAGHRCVDAHATAIKNATRVSYVGAKFLKEIVEDYFLDRWIIPSSVRQETKVKYYNRATIVIPNGISPDIFPELQAEDSDASKPGLAKRFRPEDDLLEAKRLNLVKFQQRVGLTVNPDAILFYWPSRLDLAQKGVELLEQIAQRFTEVNPDTQIAVVGDPVGGDNTHADIMGRIACASGSRVGYQRFNQDLSILGYAAASDVFGASLYEPFGQIDVVGNIYGATATNRDTGGYSDKIAMLSLRAWGDPIDRGNGVLFRNYDAGGLWWGLSKAAENHRYFRAHPKEWEKQMRRIMIQARNDWSLDNMVARYITAYEELNGGKPLA